MKEKTEYVWNPGNILLRMAQGRDFCMTVNDYTVLRMKPPFCLALRYVFMDQGGCQDYFCSP